MKGVNLEALRMKLKMLMTHFNNFVKFALQTKFLFAQSMLSNCRSPK